MLRRTKSSERNKREALAKGLFEFIHKDEKWKDQNREVKELWSGAALVAIKLMERPTAEMITEGFFTAPTRGRFTAWDIIGIYNGMIRVAEKSKMELKNR